MGLGANQSGINYTIKVGDGIIIPSLDLGCFVAAVDEQHVDPGPSMGCFRQSMIRSKAISASFEVTRYHIRLIASGTGYLADTITRSP
jgi:hypothetical protein